MLSLVTKNFQNTEVIPKIRLCNFNKARKEVVDGKVYYYVQVPEHKTVMEHGSAQVFMDENIYNKLEIYVKNYRKFILSNSSKEDHGYLFTGWRGLKISSDLMNKSIKNIWKAAGCTSNIGSTILRKTITSAVQAKYEQKDKVKLASLLNHRVSTAEKCYAKKKHQK